LARAFHTQHDDDEDNDEDDEDDEEDEEDEEDEDDEDDEDERLLVYSFLRMEGKAGRVIAQRGVVRLVFNRSSSLPEEERDDDCVTVTPFER
jgi:ABC-type Zn2+ transport system substrate-binding protein/surface adhesin